MTERPTNHTFHVAIPEFDVTFDVGPEQSIVEVAREYGVDILTACENGQCGTCVVRVVEGEVDHRDRALLPEKRAQGWMCACVSRAKGASLVLDVW